MKEDCMNALFDEIEENDIKVTDENENLCIWNYIGLEKEKYNFLRGFVTENTNEKKIVCPSLGPTEEYTVDDKEKYQELLRDYNEENWKWFYSLEGTLVRLYNHDSKWNLSTHKKLSAFKSRWSCRLSFGEIFIEYLKEIYPKVDEIYKYFLDKLEKDKIYYFLLRTNSQNRIICDISSIEYGKKIIFVGYRNGNSELILNDNNCHYLKDLQKPLEINNIDKENMFYFVENNINPFIHQGIIGFNCKMNKNVKLVNRKYKELSRIRGNNPNIRLRYLEIRLDQNSKLKFVQLYPTFKKLFENYEETIINIAKYILACYKKRYLEKKYITLPKEEYLIMRKCFDYSKQNRDVLLEDVIHLLNFENPLNVYKMIHRFKMSENSEKINFKQNDILFFENLLCSK